MFWCIVLNVFLIKLLLAVPDMCNKSSATEMEGNDLLIQTVLCSRCDLNGRSRRESYKVCFTSLLCSWHRRITGGSWTIPSGPYSGVGCFTICTFWVRSFPTIGSLRPTYQKVLLVWIGESLLSILLWTQYHKIDKVTLHTHYPKWCAYHVVSSSKKQQSALKIKW